MSLEQLIMELQKEQERLERLDQGSGRDVLEFLMAKEGKRSATMAAECGISRQCMSAKMRKNKADIPANDLAKMLATIGYELVVVKEGTVGKKKCIKIK